ncbi:unnamed protein product [Didymodactylos carnosus]|uniref:Uncharacterized protein n=1 Tax=Didymodactylos carnosus TaxID=1234261 RepID=A0A8S2FC58_9BILA|nr:unnamed protein product [Didymodactylos carnosus]CAF4221480.1 unnamed protein product [Didymodactylos carnosus]
MGKYPSAIVLVSHTFVTFFEAHSKETIIKEVADPKLLAELQEYRKQNAALLQQYKDLIKKLEEQNIDSFEDLEKFDKKGAEALVKLALQTPAQQFQGKQEAATGYGETTTVVQPYDGRNYRLFDIPGRNDDLSYFSMEYISFWKGLTKIFVLITISVKEMTKVFRLLDAINLRYSIIVNKFDLVPAEQREQFKEKIQLEVRTCGLKGVDRLFFVSSMNPQQFDDWLKMVDYLTITNNQVNS